MKHYDAYTRDSLLSFLRAKNGETAPMAELCQHFGLKPPRIASITSALVNEGMLREVQTSRRHSGYYLPTQRQLDIEAATRANEDTFRPLKPRMEHAAAVAAARAVRQQYASIG